MSGMQWSLPNTLVRGAVVEAKSGSDLASLTTAECWIMVANLSQELAKPNEPVQVLVEIWADTGRIIWILKDRREFCRVELTAVEIERSYFKMLQSNTFESEYEALVEKLKNIIRIGSSTTDLSFATSVLMRDCDTEESAEPLS
ncbi:MAG: hypothetical protein R3C53_22355 [Pirellulaceae bacterium]